MRLKRIQANYFKKIVEAELVADGRDIAIYLKNGGGKSTWFDSYLWTLVGRDSRGQADFDIKTHDQDGVPIPNVDHEVTLELLDSEARPVVLRRNYHEDHAQKRGAASTTFTGHRTDFWFNSTPVPKNDYEARVASLINLKFLRMLSDPMYFNSDELKDSKTPAWQVRRRALMEICGDVSDADVIKLNPDLSDLPKLMNGSSIDDFRKQLLGRRTEINQQIKSFPVRIDEATRSIPEVKHDQSYVVSKIKEYSGVLQSLQERRVTLAAGGEVADLTVKLREVEGELQGRLNELNSSTGSAMAEYQAKLSELRRELHSDEMSFGQSEHTVKRLTTKIGDLERERDQLRSDWKERNAQTFPDFSSEGFLCPTCGQPLAEEQVDEARATHAKNRDTWHVKKSTDLERISQNGKSVAGELTKAQDELKSSTKLLEAKKADVEGLKQKIDALQEPTDSKPDPMHDEAYSLLSKEKASIQSKIDSAKLGNSSALDNLAVEIGQCEGRLKAAREAESNIKRKAEIEKRVDTLKAGEKSLATKFETSEHHLWLTDEFLRTKVSALTDQINGHFELTKWRLFETQINGGLQEICEATFNGTPWDSMSTSERINVGLDCINALSKAHGVSMPIWIDHCESISDPISTIGQQIRLIVSPKDSVMRIEDVDYEERDPGLPKPKNGPMLPSKSRSRRARGQLMLP